MSTLLYPQAKARAAYWHTHPTSDILATGRCQGVARGIVGARSFGSSAIIAWHNVPSQYKILGKVIPGGLVYFDNPRVADSREFGHATFGIENGYVWSTDILRMGRLDLVHWTVIRDHWGMRLLGTINHTPYEALHMGVTTSTATTLPAVSLSLMQKAFAHDPSAAQGAAYSTTSRAQGKYVEKALYRLGYLPGQYVDGSMGTLTRSAYATFQRSCGYSGAGANGIPGKDSLTKLGLKTGYFRVVA